MRSFVDDPAAPDTPEILAARAEMDRLLTLLLDSGGSDLHLRVGHPRYLIHVFHQREDELLGNLLLRPSEGSGRCQEAQQDSRTPGDCRHCNSSTAHGAPFLVFEEKRGVPVGKLTQSLRRRSERINGPREKVRAGWPYPSPGGASR